eukprot:TRINITY_DN65544_c0_g1_i1.p1 TRINITY_DN65544_c0_g1~~TRINITY_DN65544_c0_g1_i1.p1  ORF type:complete len:168 (-),score=32.33 TRINITY_DN65544_c0_g1_i1:493-996(-)
MLAFRSVLLLLSTHVASAIVRNQVVKTSCRSNASLGANATKAALFNCTDGDGNNVTSEAYPGISDLGQQSFNATESLCVSCGDILNAPTMEWKHLGIASEKIEFSSTTARDEVFVTVAASAQSSRQTAWLDKRKVPGNMWQKLQDLEDSLRFAWNNPWWWARAALSH